MSELADYTKAMIQGRLTLCMTIEQRHGLFGYPPELVSVGLNAFDKGEDVDAAIAAYTGETA